MTVQKILIGGIIVGALAFSARPALALAWDWPYPWADPKAAHQDQSAESHATESALRQPEFVASRGVGALEKDRSHTDRDKSTLRSDRNDPANDRSEFNRDRAELYRR